MLKDHLLVRFRVLLAFVIFLDSQAELDGFVGRQAAPAVVRCVFSSALPVMWLAATW